LLNRIPVDYSRAFDIATLARNAGMNLSSFQAHFKAVTSSSPLRYPRRDTAASFGRSVRCCR
jgi:AraC-like DNA-binding protein